MWLPDGEEILMLAFFVLTQYRRVTDRQTDRHVAVTPHLHSVARVKTHMTTVTDRQMDRQTDRRTHVHHRAVPL